MMFIGLLESVGIFLLIPLIGVTGILDFGTEEIAFLSWMTDLFAGMSETINGGAKYL